MFGSGNMRTRVSIRITVEQSHPKIITKFFSNLLNNPRLLPLLSLSRVKNIQLFQMLLNNIIPPFPPRIVSFWKILGSLRGDKNTRSYLPISIEKLRHPFNPITNPHERVKLVNIFILFFFPSLSFLFFSPLSRHNSEFSEQ